MATCSWPPADTGPEQPVSFDPDADETQPSSLLFSVAPSLSVVEAAFRGEDLSHVTPDQRGSQQSLTPEAVAGQSQPESPVQADAAPIPVDKAALAVEHDEPDQTGSVVSEENAESSMLVPVGGFIFDDSTPGHDSLQLDSPDSAVLTMTRLRAELEEHAARRASLCAEIDVAAEGRIPAQQCAQLLGIPPRSTVEPAQLQQDTLPVKQALCMQDGQLSPLSPSAQHPHVELPIPCAEELGDRCIDSRHVPESEPQGSRQGFELQWLPTQPSPRPPAIQVAAVSLPYNNALYQPAPVSPHTQVNWLLPLYSQLVHVQRGEVAVQRRVFSQRPAHSWAVGRWGPP